MRALRTGYVIRDNDVCMILIRQGLHQTLHMGHNLHMGYALKAEFVNEDEVFAYFAWLIVDPLTGQEMVTCWLSVHHA